MKRFIASIATALALHPIEAALAHDAVTMVASGELSDYLIDVRNNQVDVRCIKRCQTELHFHTALSGIPLGIIQQSDAINSYTIYLKIGSIYHIYVLYLTDKNINGIFEKYTDHIPKLGCDNNANPEITISSNIGKSSAKNSDKPALIQTWVENGNHFKLKVN